MGVGSCISGSGLEMVSEVPLQKTETVLPAQISGIGDICQQDALQGHNREMQFLSLSGASFQCPKERLDRKENYLGLVGPQQIHSLSKVQDDDASPDSDFAAKIRRHLFIRSQRRLLARPSQPSFPPIFGIPPRTESFQVQSDALRPQYRSEGIHEAGQGHSQAASSGGNSDLGLFGRLADLGRVSRSVQGSVGTSLAGGSAIRLPDKLGKISVDPSEDLCLARSQVVPFQGDTIFNEGVSGQSGSFSEEVQESVFVHPQGIGEANGSSIVCSNSGSHPENHIEGSKQSADHQGKASSAGPSGTDEEESKSPSETMGKQCVLEEVSSFGSPSRVYDHPYGCFNDRLGGPLGVQNSVRQLVSGDATMSHQHIGTHGSLSDVTNPQSTEGLACPPLHRQPGCSQLSQARGLPSEKFESRGLSYHKTCIQTRLVSVPGSSGGGTECTSRLTFQADPSGGRVVLRQSVISEYFQGASKPGDRPVCHSGEQQTSPVRHSILRSGGSGERRTLTGLEPIPDDISVSASESSFEGFGPSSRVQGGGSSGCSFLAEQPVVSSSPTAERQPQAHPEPDSIPTRSRRGRLQRLLVGPKPTRMEFIQSFFQNRKYTEEAAGRLSRRVRGGSSKQYQAAWNRWLNYIREKKPAKLSKRFMVEYFMSLFDSQGFQVSTIRSHRSALFRPLKLGFKVNLHKDVFTHLFEALALERPAPEKRPVSWSLDVVLQNLNKRIVLKDFFLLQKTVFLLAIAMGARISEVGALRREDEHLLLREDCAVFSFGDFLTKNEKPLERREPITIQSLPTNKRLCPVATLRLYLQRTSHLTSGPLFVNTNTDAPLKNIALARLLVKFIQELHPGSNPRSHDCRKVSSSLAFLGGMGFNEISSFTGWAGHRVFVKHYLSQIRGARTRCIALGKPVGGQ